MSQQEPQTNGPGAGEPAGPQPAAFRRAPADAPTAPLPELPRAPGETPQERPRQARLRCPFCGGGRFDAGRDIYAGLQPVLYCRKTPAPGEAPDPQLSLPLKGAVCLDCGFVAAMVDIARLHAPIARPVSVADLLAKKAGQAPRDSNAVEEIAAAALAEMENGEKRPPPTPQPPGGPKPRPPADPAARTKSIFRYETEE